MRVNGKGGSGLTEVERSFSVAVISEWIVSDMRELVVWRVRSSVRVDGIWFCCVDFYFYFYCFVLNLSSFSAAHVGLWSGCCYYQVPFGYYFFQQSFEYSFRLHYEEVVVYEFCQ